MVSNVGRTQKASTSAMGYRLATPWGQVPKAAQAHATASNIIQSSVVENFPQAEVVQSHPQLQQRHSMKSSTATA